MRCTGTFSVAIIAAALAAAPAYAGDCGVGNGTPGGTLAAPAAPAPCRGGREPVQLHPAPKPPPGKKGVPHDFEVDHTTVKAGGYVGTEIGTGVGYGPGNRR